MSGTDRLKQGASHKLIKNTILITLVLQDTLKCSNAEIPGNGASVFQRFNPQISAKTPSESHMIDINKDSIFKYLS